MEPGKKCLYTGSSGSSGTSSSGKSSSTSSASTCSQAKMAAASAKMAAASAKVAATSAAAAATSVTAKPPVTCPEPVKEKCKKCEKERTKDFSIKHPSSQSKNVCLAKTKGQFNLGGMLSNVVTPVENSEHKITIIGCGAVGMACATAILAKGISRQLCLIDMFADKVKGELLDLQHGSVFMNSPKLSAGTDYGLTMDSRIIIVTSGARQKEGETRLQLLQRNVDIFKDVIPKAARCSPEAVFVIVANPVDVMTYVARKLSGFPPSKVLGSGTHLDSARFRFLLSQKMGVAPNDVGGYIIGEHGDTSVPVWSTVSVCGMNLGAFIKNVGSDSSWKDIHKEVIQSAAEVIKLKGYTAWAIGYSTADIVDCILHNDNLIKVVSVPAKDIHGIKEDIYLSLPAALGECGIVNILHLPLTDEETDQLRRSANTLWEHIKNLKFEMK